MKKMKLVLVGNGMAGVRTLEELLKLAPDLYDITVFGAEPHPNYNRILLSPVLAGEQTLKEIVLNDLDWYQSNNITLHLGKKITEISRIKRVVLADDVAVQLRDDLARAQVHGFHQTDSRVSKMALPCLGVNNSLYEKMLFLGW
jgi:NAD(P)H-nitrite reductase large subunit